MGFGLVFINELAEPWSLVLHVGTPEIERFRFG